MSIHSSNFRISKLRADPTHNLCIFESIFVKVTLFWDAQIGFGVVLHGFVTMDIIIRLPTNVKRTRGFCTCVFEAVNSVVSLVVFVLATCLFARFFVLVI